MSRPSSTSFVSILVLLCGCSGNAPEQSTTTDQASAATRPEPLLRSVPADSSGIRFANVLTETDTFNYYLYEYIYNGGGVATGDLNGDGLTDIYFTGNMSGDKLYLNRGGLHFEDVTGTSVANAGAGWHTGVTMADVNNDGRLDIHVCRAGNPSDPQLRTNLCYLNDGNGADGIPTFSEHAAEMGIADTARSDQGIFFDHDGDGDLDLYIANTPLQWSGVQTADDMKALVRSHRAPTSRLYRNDMPRKQGAPGGVPHFTDITTEAGLWTIGFSLGVAVSDFNGDHHQDIYVANDYVSADRMWISDGRGHYTDEVNERTRHISNYGMGCDAADFNNDGLVDLAVLDMVSDDHARSKQNMGAMAPAQFWGTINAGYQYQYMFNTLQLNNGNGTFSEMAQLAGVSKTDWSWAPLFCDLDNDGWKDLLVTNGYKRDMRDNDYQSKLQRIEHEGKRPSFSKMLELVPATRIRSYLFHNNGDLTFSNKSEEWGFTMATNDNGAAYADLDNDGDLDLVINNLDEPASLFENRAVQQGKGNWLRVKLEGAGGGLAMGAQVRIRAGGQEQLQELMLTRGYESSVEPILHFGLGAADHVDEVRVRWPDGTESVREDVKAGHVLDIDRSDRHPAASTPAPKPLFAENAAGHGLTFQHKEDVYDDLEFEVLLPHKQSANGPLLGTADVNGDGLDDLFIGGARDQSGLLYLQLANGRFAPAPSQPWTQQKACEDMGSLFFDADGDGDMDLFVASGGNEVDMRREQYDSRLYMNDGKGGFTHSTDRLPSLACSAFRATATDIDGDSDQDLFIGGRVVPGAYPTAPRSYLLLNDGAGRFSDATEQLAPALMAPGMITDAEFIDYDGDKDPDLVVVGEWMPIGFFENTKGRFAPANDKCGLKDTEGWWWSLTSGDVDSDGDIDLVCGNIGWNNKFHCSPSHPLHVFYSDFDDNGHGDIVLAKENDQIGLVPVRGRQCSSQQCPMVQEKFQTYAAFAHASVQEIYTPEKIDAALHLQAKHMRSCVLLNIGGGRFTLKDLPEQAQLAPIMGSVLFDADGDGKLDLVIAGNHWDAEIETVRYDGGTGLLLLGDGAGGFTPESIARSGIFAWNNVKDLALVHLGPARTPMVVVANNNAPMQAFRSNVRAAGLLGQR